MPICSYEKVSLPAGSLLFREGEAGPVAFLIERGQVEVYTVRDGRDHRLALRGAGELIGEMAILDNQPRSASARAIEDCELIVISGAQFSSRLGDMDPIMRMCLTMVIDRYRETLRMVGNQGSAGEAAVASPVSQEAIDTLVLGHDLDRALRQNELLVYFQPIVDLRTRRLAGFEALMRWNHPTRGMVMPGSFIPLAEATGQIIEMTAWCLNKVAKAYPDIATAALSNIEAVDPLFMSVNISSKDLARPSFLQMVQTTLEDAGIEALNIKLEVTESMLMKDAVAAHRVLGECLNRGMGIAIDDFGTGYSSLSNLSKLPITTLKIDRSFVSAMTIDPISQRIVQTILRMAEEMGMSVVAEGIEDEESASALTRLGCQFGQGYLFGKAVALQQTIKLVRDWKACRQVESAHVNPARNAAIKSA